MKEINNQTVVVLLAATLLISLGSTIYTLNIVKNMGVGGGITGFAVVPNGTASLTIQQTSSIRFSQGTVAFGTGSVNTSGGFTNCSLTTLGYNTGCADFSVVTNGFTVENDGNTNLSVTLRTNLTAANFIGQSSAAFGWNVTANESGSCRNTSAAPTAAGAAAVVAPNTSGTDGCGGGACGAIFEEVSTTAKTVCPRLLFEDTQDALNIDLNITIPESAPTGLKYVGLIVSGAREPTS